MSTTRLFDQDAYLGEFEATVERSVCEGGMYRVLLDQTAFFPEGGGQPADEGTLDGIFVTDVQEIDGEIWHTVEAPLEPGKTVVGKHDFEKRFSNMQNHCGEHIVSGIVHRIYGFNNVGFHMGSDVITVDFDGVLTEEQLYDVAVNGHSPFHLNVPVSSVLEFLLLLLLPESFLLLFPGSAHLTAGLLNYDILLFSPSLHLLIQFFFHLF